MRRKSNYLGGFSMENDLNQNNAPVVQNPNQAVMSMGQWIVTILVTTIIPCVNIIMLFVWGFGNGNENRKNYCRAMLIVMAISIVLSIIFSSAITALLVGAMSAAY